VSYFEQSTDRVAAKAEGIKKEGVFGFHESACRNKKGKVQAKFRRCLAANPYLCLGELLAAAVVLDAQHEGHD
jgi:hypothetical protein